jgi:hypothetical protein
MDSVLSDRVFVGDSLSNPDGTLIDFFNQVCQKPFVEFWGDTWGSYFNFTVRQPPFTKSAIKNVIDNQYYLTINQRDIINISLSFDERCYSSYEIEPNNTFFGSEDGLFKAIVPALYINEYAEIWGNKRYSVKDSYVHKNSLFGGDASLDSSKFIEGLLNDYKYIIETNAYLPFTRKGSITINGDRRIKKGTFVFNEATNEIFYVSGVSNTLSINRQKISRTTTLQVERGMIKDFINRKSVADTDGIVRFFSYFDIVNVDAFVNQIRKSINVSNEKKTTTESKVKLSLVLNKDNFQFFLRRGQL